MLYLLNINLRLEKQLFNPVLKEHFLRPRGMKRVAEPNFHAIKKSGKCNDVVRLSVVIDGGDTIEDIGAEVYGCGYSIAGASILNECAKGSRIDQVENKFEKSVQPLLNDVPESNHSCVRLALEVFKLIYEQYGNTKR